MYVSNLRRYIEARQGYVFEMQQRDDHVVKIMSTPEEQARIEDKRNAPTSPGKTLGKDGHILKHEFQKKSGNLFFDQALETAIQRARLPPPPPEVARQLRDGGVVLNFKP